MLYSIDHAVSEALGGVYMAQFIGMVKGGRGGNYGH